MTVRPRRSITFVFGHPGDGEHVPSLPTATNLPPRTATAVAVGLAGSRVVILPLFRIRSAWLSSAPRVVPPVSATAP